MGARHAAANPKNAMLVPQASGTIQLGRSAYLAHHSLAELLTPRCQWQTLLVEWLALRRANFVDLPLKLVLAASRVTNSISTQKDATSAMRVMDLPLTFPPCWNLVLVISIAAMEVCTVEVIEIRVWHAYQASATTFCQEHAPSAHKDILDPKIHPSEPQAVLVIRNAMEAVNTVGKVLQTAVCATLATGTTTTKKLAICVQQAQAQTKCWVIAATPQAVMVNASLIFALSAISVVTIV